MKGEKLFHKDPKVLALNGPIVVATTSLQIIIFISSVLLHYISYVFTLNVSNNNNYYYTSFSPRTHMRDLKDMTNNFHYENYRSKKLAAVTYNGVDNNKNKGQLTK